VTSRFASAAPAATRWASAARPDHLHHWLAPAPDQPEPTVWLCHPGPEPDFRGPALGKRWAYERTIQGQLYRTNYARFFRFRIPPPRERNVPSSSMDIGSGVTVLWKSVLRTLYNLPPFPSGVDLVPAVMENPPNPPSTESQPGIPMRTGWAACLCRR